MAQVSRRFEGREVLNPAAAPFYLMMRYVPSIDFNNTWSSAVSTTSAMGMFSLQLMGYVLFCGPNPPVVTDFWSDISFRALLCALFFFGGIFIGRMTHFAVELGNPQVVNDQQLELLDEKV